MAKEKKAYVCSYCGQESAKWIGRCPACGQWNTFKEITLHDTAKNTMADVLPALAENNGVRKLAEISAEGEQRLDMHDSELNRVLGGGLVKGSLVLLGGEPGIGKSTLTLQTILNINDINILYVSGEESLQQLKMRAERLSGNSLSQNTNVSVLCENSLENIFAVIKETAPQLLIVDSIQTISTDRADASPGTITQVRECAAMLLRYKR